MVKLHMLTKNVLIKLQIIQKKKIFESSLNVAEVATMEIFSLTKKHF